MACAGAVTAQVLTAGAGMVGDLGGPVLKSVTGIPNSITDSVTGLTGPSSMAALAGNQSAFQGLASSSALTNTLGKVGTLPTSFQSSLMYSQEMPQVQ